MVTQVLVDKEIALGMDVFRLLGSDPILKPTAAMWIFDEDALEWRYLIATEFAATRGPKAAYLRVQSILRRAGRLGDLPLSRCVVVSPSDRMVSTMASAVSKTGDGGAIFCNNCMLNDIRVTAHIYFLQQAAKTSAKPAKRKANPFFKNVVTKASVGGKVKVK